MRNSLMTKTSPITSLLLSADVRDSRSVKKAPRKGDSPAIADWGGKEAEHSPPQGYLKKHIKKRKIKKKIRRAGPGMKPESGKKWMTLPTSE